MGVSAWLDKKMQYGPTASHSPWHNPTTFGEMTRITYNTLSMHFVLLEHRVYFSPLFIIRTVWVTHGRVGTTVIRVTYPQFARNFCNKSRFMATLQCQKLTYVVWVSDEQICKLQNIDCRSVRCFVMWHDFSGRYLASGIWLENYNFHNYVIAHSPHTAALVTLWCILGGGRMTALHAICSVPWPVYIL